MPSDLLDIQRLDGYKRDLVVTLFEMFQERFTKLFPKFKAAADELNHTACWQQAHAIKSSCLNLGAKGLGEIFAEAEALGRAEKAKEAALMIESMDEVYQSSVKALETYLQKRS